jgi:hypothetical protein
MKKYLVGASIPIILYVLYVFVNPVWLAYQYSLRERLYVEEEFYSDARRPPENKQNIKFLYTPNGWLAVLNTLSTASKNNEVLHKPEFYKNGSPILEGTFLQNRLAQKIHLRVWNKRSNAKDLLCETVSELTIGSFVMDKDTFWIPIIQRTQSKILQGFSVGNVLRFYTRFQEDGSLETNLSLVQNFSAMKSYRFQSRFEDGTSVSFNGVDIDYTLISFKIISKNNKYNIVQGNIDKEVLERNKYFFNEEDAKRIGLKNLGLDMYEVGTIEIEVVK